MVWKKSDPKTGKNLYIQGGENSPYLSTRKGGASEGVPDGWKIASRKDGSLKIIPKN